MVNQAITSKTSISLKLVLLLSAVFMLSPFAIDTYLPAVQLIATDLGVPDSMVAMTISIYVFGMSFGQLAGGTLSDVFGRKNIMIAGLLVFSICSVFLSTVNSEFGLIFWRIVQSLGGGIAVVGVPATIRDHASGKEAAKLFALIGLIMLISPTVAPTIGTVILQFFTWNWIFYFLATFPLILVILIIIYMPPSVRKPFENPIKIYGLIFKEKKALVYLIAQVFTFTTLLTFVANSSIIYISHFNVSIEVFSVLFVSNVAGVIFANRLNVYLLRKHEPSDLLRIFLTFQLLGSVSALIVTILFPTYILAVVPCMVVAIGSTGGIIPNSISCFLGHFGKHAGIASGLIGASQYIIAGTISGVSTFAYSSASIIPVFIIMAICSSIAFYGVFTAKKVQETV